MIFCLYAQCTMQTDADTNDEQFQYEDTEAEEEAEEGPEAEVQTLTAETGIGQTAEETTREVVAESLTDILPDSGFMQDLAEEHKNIFEKLADKLHEFLDNLRAYFSKLGYNQYRGAQALNNQLFDERETGKHPAGKHQRH